MKLIRKLPTRKNKNGNYTSHSLYECPVCLQEVEKQLGSGLVAKSCGKKECRPKYNQGENHPMYGKKHTEVSNKKNSESQKGKVITEEHRQNISKGHIGLISWNKGGTVSEETKNKIKLGNTDKKRTEKQKENYSKAFKGRVILEEQRQKISETMLKNGTTKGCNNPNWQEGISKNPYPIEFNKPLKQSILERDNYECQNPECTEIHDILHVYHIDYNKKNSNSENLITLCDSCNMKTNGKKKRLYFTEFYQNIMINRIIECLL